MDKESSLGPRTGFERHCARHGGYPGWQIIGRARHGVEHQCSSSVIGNCITELLREHKKVGPCCPSTERQAGGWCEIHRSDLTLSIELFIQGLLVPQCLHRVHGSRSPRRRDISQSCHRNKQHRHAPPRMSGSRELSVTHFAAILSKITLSANPAASPRPHSPMSRTARSASRPPPWRLAPCESQIHWSWSRHRTRPRCSCDRTSRSIESGAT